MKLPRIIKYFGSCYLLVYAVLYDEYYLIEHFISAKYNIGNQVF